jgi:protein arginine kinase activator
VKCQFCSNPATVHLANIENNQKKELHLCQACAASHQLIKQHELNLPAILQTLIGQHVGPLTDELSRLACPACSIRYMEFRAAGRLGCPHDYDVFRSGLEPLLQRIHRAVRHVGKRPRHHQAVAPRPDLIELQRRLREAIEAEAYEEAARFRDLIRQLKGTEQPPSS